MLTDDQIKHMVDRFLGWKLPEDFHPDAGISFKREYNEHTPWGPSRHEPIGTNLLSATQAEAMVRYLLDGMPAHVASTPPDKGPPVVTAICPGCKRPFERGADADWAKCVACTFPGR